jgi:hypothetical protein
MSAAAGSNGDRCLRAMVEFTIEAHPIKKALRHPAGAFFAACDGKDDYLFVVIGFVR